MSQLVCQYHKSTIEYFTEDLGDGVALDLVLILGGSFQVGSANDQLEHSDREEPQHLVTVPTFFMGRYLVTQAQWRQVAAMPQVKLKLDSQPSRFIGDNLPVEQVSWHDATEFCQRLSRHTKRDYQLPSEAQWEYSCRAGTTTPFHCGETISTDLANYDGSYEKSGAYGRGKLGIYRKETTPVGNFPPNSFGLYDMHGNVWQWCADDWHQNYEGAPTDGSAWLTGNKNYYRDYRVLRGGSWSFSPSYCRSAYRRNNDPNDRYYDFGFRVTCVAP